MEEFVTKVVRDGNTLSGRYMSVADAQWSKLGDATVVREADGTFITFLNAANPAPPGL
jgi:hypothetical protein